MIQLDFSDSDPALLLDPTFAFDFSPLDGEINGYLSNLRPDLPVVWTANTLGCFCPSLLLPLPAGGSLHLGNIGMELPEGDGAFRLDVLNADEPDQAFGALLQTSAAAVVSPPGELWRAFTRDITGGQFDFIVPPPIPTLSQWGLLAMTLLLLGIGGWMIRRASGKTRSAGPRIVSCVDRARPDINGADNVPSGKARPTCLRHHPSAPPDCVFRSSMAD